MKKEFDELPENQVVWMQRWEESEAGWGVREDGMSLHLTEEDAKAYVEEIYAERDPNGPVPHEYSRHDGRPRRVEILKPDLYNKIIENEGRLRTYKSLYTMTKKDMEIKII